MSRPHIEPYDERGTAFRRLTLPGFPRGTHYKALSVDGESGACSLILKLEGGWRRPAGFSYTEMEIFVLDGEVRCGADRLGPGRYLWIPAGVPLAEMSVPRGARLLAFYNYGEPTFEASAEGHADAFGDGMVDLDTYHGMQWNPVVRKAPGVAPGCMTKVLRVDPVTKACTFLYCMTPNYWQDNISYHDCAEESYHIWGTSWMMQFGYLPTGGYFWRPPYINHGAFASQLGCVALGRTDAELFNYFHFDPWTQIEQNRRRAIRVLRQERPELHRWALAEAGHNHPTAAHLHADGTAHVHEHATGHELESGHSIRRARKP
ncbi:MAG: DUF4437 domain-containing protein [Steroidobacteraceae bacterium]|nr:DUF4437 domain-containing protein [Steroidobacteraceae bacterium]